MPPRIILNLKEEINFISINQLNKIKVISSNARSALNEGGEKRAFGKDIDYLVAINQDEEDLSKGVYTGYIGNST